MRTVKSGIFQRTLQFFTEDLWHFSDHKDKRYWYLLPLRILYQSVHQFRANKLTMTATALTFYTLMSIVPILAVAFAIAQGFQLESHLEKALMSTDVISKEFAQECINYARKQLAQTNTAGIAGVGALLLFWTVIRLFMIIESAFNGVWRVRFGRSIIRCGTDYLAMLFFFLFALIAMSSFTYISQSFLPNLVHTADWIPWKEEIIFMTVKVSSVVVIGLIFTAIYIAVPHTHVKINAGIVGGMVTAIILFITLQYAVHGIFNLAKFNAIYGSLAPLPIFLFWLQLSWMIILFGAEVSYVAQNLDYFAYQKEWAHLSKREHALCALLVLRSLAIHFKNHDGPITIPEIVKETQLPKPIVEDALNHLMEASFISSIEPKNVKDTQKYWQLACNSNELTLAQGVLGLNQKGEELPTELQTHSVRALRRELQKIEAEIAQSGNILLCDVTIQNKNS